ncbi:hypothetical protein M011DRAFT_471419 [Sporormia fimetaria CBS 119925]|uniref:Uncharacterized protein n=1 Tax=Sporormia fimetaria CBS 119925 TaxID=1340428 RepID=A0A6A6V112_9PLEO|nr:hypothetical protein M011DRAFT_471419 [Sporormia fimetaria CBS 119925]
MAGNVHKQFVNVDDEQIGLDRSNINPHGQMQLAKDDQPDFTPTRTTDLNTSRRASTGFRESSEDHSKREKIKEKTDHAKHKLKKALHIKQDSVHSTASDGPTDAAGNRVPAPILAESVQDPSQSRYEHELPQNEKKTMKDLVHDPVNTVKEKVTGEGSHQAAANIAAKEIPHGQDVELVRAHDRLQQAHTETERLLAIQDMDELIRERQNMFVRWTMDRHITKLRRLPKGSFPKKTMADFTRKDPTQGTVTDWRGYMQHHIQYYSQQLGGEYIGYGSEPPKPSKETMMPNVERLLIASAPLQEWAMTIRRVYRWEVPSETAKYLVIYLTLWFFNLLLPGAISFFIYLVAERRLHGRTIEDLRADIQRTEDTNKTAYSISELIEKRGDEHWADEAIEKLGPWAMVQLADAANALEVVRNFYEWRKPHRTASTLVVMALGALITLFIPLWLLVKSATFGMGFAFFGLWPIATNYPDYRLLVSPVKQIFWNIPTHAEWAVKSLQAKGTRYVVQHPNASTTDLNQYKSHYKHTTGRLVLSPSDLHFVSKTGKNEVFRIHYSDIDRLEKVDRIISKNLPKPEPIKDSGKDLRIVVKGGKGGVGAREEEFVLNNVDDRDEAFGQIVGFSDTDWQVVW